MLLQLLDGAPASTLDAVLSSAAAFAEWLYLPAEVRGSGCSQVQVCAHAACANRRRMRKLYCLP